MAQLMLKEGVAPDTPPLGYVTIFVKGDGHLYQLDDQGVETPFVGNGDLHGPDGAVAGNFLIFDGTTGKYTLDSGVSAATFLVAATTTTANVPDSMNKRYVTDAQLALSHGVNDPNSSTTHIGTTSIALNRASGAQSLTGITSIDGAAATVTGLSVTAGKTLSVSNSLTLAGTDASTLNVGTGGTLGTAAYTAATAYDVAGAAAAVTPTTLGLVIGTNVQAYDADLTTWAGITPGTGVATALAVAVGSAGAPVVNGGALGTPSSGSLANCTAYPGTSALTTVGALNAGSITSGFGAIDVGTDAISGGATSVTTLTGSGLYALFGGMTSRTGLYVSNQQTVSNDGTGNLPFVSSNSWSSASGGSGGLILGHSKSGVIGTHTTVANQDGLGTITFVGSDGTAFRQAASIYVIANDTVAANQVPGKLVINTTAITGNTGANFLTFDSAALLSVGTISTTRFSVDGATGNGSFAGTLSATGIVTPGTFTTGTRPTKTLGGIIFDTTLNKLLIGGASAWEAVTSV